MLDDPARRPGVTLRTTLQGAAFRRFLVAQAVAQTATWLHRVALVWVAVEVSGGQGTVVGLMTALQFAPMAIATVAGGRLGDRADRRALLVRTQLVVAAACGMLAILDFSGELSVVVALLGAGVLGVLAGIDTPVRLAHVPSLVPRDLVRSATSVNSATFNVAKLAGPALAGLLIAWLNTATVFTVTTAFALVAAWLLWQLPPGSPGSDPPGERGSRKLAAAWHIARRRIDMLLPLVLGLVFGAATTNLQVAIPLMASLEFGQGAAGYGALTAALAGGSILGAMASAVRRPKNGIHELLWLLVGLCLAQFVAAAAPDIVSFGVLLVLTGGILLAGNTASLAMLQLCSPPSASSRVLGMYVLAFFAWSPIGGPMLGLVADAAGVRAVLFASAALSVGGLAAAATMVRRQPPVRGMDGELR